MAKEIQHSTKSHWRLGLLPFACAALIGVVAILFFAVDIRYGFPHFDTYQYSASVGPQATGMRPKLLWVEGLPEFKNGAELALPGVYWAKLALFSAIPYGFEADVVISFIFLVLGSVIALLLLRQAGWGRLAAFLMFSLILTSPTFLVNVTGTRPEPLAVLLLLAGMLLIRKGGAYGWAFAGGLLLGFAGIVHVYAALLGPMLAVAAWLSREKTMQRRDLKILGWIALGVVLGWSVLVIFWRCFPDAWHLFRLNLAIQRTFHRNPGRFIAYLQSFRLGSGWWVALLLGFVPLVSWFHWFRTGQSWSALTVSLVITSCCLVIPVAFWLLKTEQYFYGDLIWPALVAALVLAGRKGLGGRSVVTLLLLLGVSGGVARLAARTQLGIQLRGSKPAREQRLDWLKEHVAGAPRLYVFTPDWDIAAEAGVNDVRLYAFPLPMTPELVSKFEAQTFAATPDGAMMLFDRDFAPNCPYANAGAFDPAHSTEWDMLETHIWHYDLSPNKPAARVWELWRKKPQP